MFFIFSIRDWTETNLFWHWHWKPCKVKQKSNLWENTGCCQQMTLETFYRNSNSFRAIWNTRFDEKACFLPTLTSSSSFSVKKFCSFAISNPHPLICHKIRSSPQQWRIKLYCWLFIFFLLSFGKSWVELLLLLLWYTRGDMKTATWEGDFVGNREKSVIF